MTKIKSLKRLACSLVPLALLLGAGSALAQVITSPVNEYSSKFVCGLAATTATTGTVSTMVQPGTYSTSINIHNPALPSANTAPVTFYKKAVISNQEGQTQVPPSSLKTDQLPPDFSEEVDCTTIANFFSPPLTIATNFYEGWVVIYVPQPASTGASLPLDVEGVYTNLKGALKVRPATLDKF
jgi:hypothetical protein